MDDVSLQNEMSITVFLYCLQHLKSIWDNSVRILWWEPLLHSKIESFFQLAVKGGFNMVIFSNFKVSHSKLERILDLGESFEYHRLHFNLNLNDKDFYQSEELEIIYRNLEFLTQKWVDVMISYNVYEYSGKYDFIFETAQKYAIRKVILKVTNTVYGDEEIIDSNTQKYGSYMFEILQKYAQDFDIGFGCGLSQSIFTQEQKDYIHTHTNISLKYGCENNGGKYDINTDGGIFRCYPLQYLYEGISELNIKNEIFRNMPYQKLRSFMEARIPRKKYNLSEDENCLWNQINTAMKNL